MTHKNLMIYCTIAVLALTAFFILTSSGQLIGPGGVNTKNNSLDVNVNNDVGGLIGGGTVNMANPASTFCENNGGTSKNGMCVFPDGSSCEEWAYMRGECSPNGNNGNNGNNPVIGPGGENPAAVYCQNQGYEYDLTDGSCNFPDGSSCDAWDYYRGDCQYNPNKNIIGPGGENPASVYCTEHGGTVEIKDGPTGQYGMCIFPDGSSCEEWAYMRGECSPNPPKPTPTYDHQADYVCPSVMTSSSQNQLTSYDQLSDTSTDVYFQGSYQLMSSFTSNPLTSSSMWIKTVDGWSWYAVSPINAYVPMLAYLPSGGSVSLYRLSPGSVVQKIDLGYSLRGYYTIWFYASSPGRYMDLFTINDIPSNAVIVDVKGDWTPCG